MLVAVLTIQVEFTLGPLISTQIRHENKNAVSYVEQSPGENGCRLEDR